MMLGFVVGSAIALVSGVASLIADLSSRMAFNKCGDIENQSGVFAIRKRELRVLMRFS